MNYRKHFKENKIGHFFSVPFIWAPLPFFIFLDIVIEIYHQTCFPIYGLEKVKRSEYIQILDRSRLKYLNLLEKVSCMYCGYANGLLLYLKEITGRTESYWCGVMHENKPGFKIHSDQVERQFPEFGDEKKFKERYG